jgi:hypothetical protein
MRKRAVNYHLSQGWKPWLAMPLILPLNLVYAKILRHRKKAQYRGIAIACMSFNESNEALSSRCRTVSTATKQFRAFAHYDTYGTVKETGTGKPTRFRGRR